MIATATTFEVYVSDYLRGGSHCVGAGLSKREAWHVARGQVAEQESHVCVEVARAEGDTLTKVWHSFGEA